MSGEQVVYAYDALNRLLSAQATNGFWGQSYGYDGFGNLTDQNVIAGTAPSMHVVYDPATNRQTGESADANGNLGGYGYDVENRIGVLPLTSTGCTMSNGVQIYWLNSSVFLLLCAGKQARVARGDHDPKLHGWEREAAALPNHDR